MNTATIVYSVIKHTTTICGLETEEVIGERLSEAEAMNIVCDEQPGLINNRRMSQKLRLIGFQQVSKAA